MTLPLRHPAQYDASGRGYPHHQSSDSTDAGTEATEGGTLSAEDLQQLVAPIALYPDTLLIQVLVAATYPLQVIKASQFAEDNAEMEPDAFQTAIEAEGWDDSVAVLATAFPDVLARMADHIDWTETIGAAMMVQDEDVMDAIQVKRAEADATGNLQTTPEQTVEVTQGDTGDQTIIIQPADPEVVYVPQYDTQTVYTESSDSNDALTNAVIFFGTAILINEIFRDDNYWNGYWGCRNCCGWGGRPHYPSPRNVNIINGNVNIGNNVGWRPDDRRKREAQRTLDRRTRPGGPSTLPARTPSRGDDLRRDLSNRTGTPDISRPGNRDAARDTARQLDRSGGVAGRDLGTQQRPSASRDAIDRTKRPAAGGGAVQRPAAKAPSRPSARQQIQRQPSANRGGGGAALKQRAPGGRAQSGAARGRASAGGGRRR